MESLCNKNYEGDVTKGNSVKILTVNNPTVRDYTKGGTITVDDVEGTEQDLEINQQKYWAVKVDDVVKHQSSAELLDCATNGAGFALADELDKYIIKQIVDNATIKMGTTKAKPMKWESGLSLLADITESLDNAKAPMNDRFIVVSPKVAKWLTLELTDKLTNNGEIVTTGFIGSLYGLNVYKSNNVESLVFGCRDYLTLANQIKETEVIRMETTFADCVRGLSVYGAKVTNDTVFGSVYVTDEDTE